MLLTTTTESMYKPAPFTQFGYLVVFEDLCKLGFTAAALAWFVRAAEPARFRWLFHW